ncbi:TraB/GumN family protein [Hoeflea sp. CAU 1731]
MKPLSGHFDAEPRMRMLLKTLSAAHLAFLVSFVAILASAVETARAQEIVCQGENLMPSLEADHPEAIAAIEAAEAETVNGKGLLWRIEKDGVEPSWLFGTMHVADPRITAMTPAAREAFDKADVIAVEVKEIGENPEKLAGVLFGNPEFSALPDGQTLGDILDEEETAVLKVALRRKGVPYISVSKMRPWLVMSMLSTRDCDAKYMQAGAMLLDMKLAGDAADSGKKLLGLEAIEEQFRAINAAPLDSQVDMLIATAALDDRMEDLHETMTALYLERRIAAIMPMLAQMSKIYGFPDGDAQTAIFEDELINKRNRTMVERAGPIIDEGNAYLAIGALHLPGDDGLVELLRKSGYTLTAVD